MKRVNFLQIFTPYNLIFANSGLHLYPVYDKKKKHGSTKLSPSKKKKHGILIFNVSESRNFYRIKFMHPDVPTGTHPRCKGRIRVHDARC